jgi:hypothetical protein
MNYGVKHLTFSNVQLFYNWLIENNITQFRIADAIAVSGYNKIIYDINVNGEYGKYYILERFDKVKLLLHNTELMDVMTNLSVYENGVITNAKIQRDWDIGSYIQITKSEYTSKNYVPSIGSIKYHISHWGNKKEWDINRNVVKIVKTRMTKTEFNNLQAKLKLLGAKNMIVDLNTLAVLNNRNIDIFTCQSSVNNLRII